MWVGVVWLKDRSLRLHLCGKQPVDCVQRGSPSSHHAVLCEAPHVRERVNVAECVWESRAVLTWSASDKHQNDNDLQIEIFRHLTYLICIKYKCLYSAAGLTGRTRRGPKPWLHSRLQISKSGRPLCSAGKDWRHFICSLGEATLKAINQSLRYNPPTFILMVV